MRRRRICGLDSGKFTVSDHICPLKHQIPAGNACQWSLVDGAKAKAWFRFVGIEPQEKKGSICILVMVTRVHEGRLKFAITKAPSKYHAIMCAIQAEITRYLRGSAADNNCALKR